MKKTIKKLLTKFRHFYVLNFDVKSKILILVYHRVLNNSSYNPLGTIVKKDIFVHHINSLIENYTIISLNDYYSGDFLKDGKLKIILTFDDAYIDNYEFVTDFHNYVNSDIFKKYFFIHGGGLSVENALKIAFDWKRYINNKNGIKVDGNVMKVIALDDAFHGITGYGLSLSDNQLKCSHFPKFNWPKFEAPSAECSDGWVCTKNFENDKISQLAKIEEYLIIFIS